MPENKKYLDIDGLRSYHQKSSQLIDKKITWDNLKNKPFYEDEVERPVLKDLFLVETTQNDLEDYGNFTAYNGFENGDYYVGVRPYSVVPTVGGEDCLFIYNYYEEDTCPLTWDFENKNLQMDIDGVTYTGKPYLFRTVRNWSHYSAPNDVMYYYIFGNLPSDREFEDSDIQAEWEASGESEFPFAVILVKVVPDETDLSDAGYVFQQFYFPVDDNHIIRLSALDSETVKTVKTLDKKYVPALKLEDLDGALTLNYEELVNFTIDSSGSLVSQSSSYDNVSVNTWSGSGTNDFEIFSWPFDMSIMDLDKKIFKVIYDGVTYEGVPIYLDGDSHPESGYCYYLLGSLFYDDISDESEEFQRKYIESGFKDYPFKMFLQADTIGQSDDVRFAVYWGYLSNDSDHTMSLYISDLGKINPKYLPEQEIPTTDVKVNYRTVNIPQTVSFVEVEPGTGYSSNVITSYV